MRNLFLALVLANLAFAAWQSWHVDADFPASRVDPATPSLVLLSEFDGTPENRRTPAPEVSRDRSVRALIPAGAECMSFGPFPSTAGSDAAAAEFELRGYAVSRQSLDGEVWLGHWVYIDAIESVEAADEMVSALIDAGISEAYVITDADGTILVSLGVFSQEVRGERRFLEARELGFEPAMTDRTRPGQVYWLDITSPDGDLSGLGAVSENVEGSGIGRRECQPN